MCEENKKAERGGNATTARRKFRKIMSGARCVAPLSVFDPISARIAQDHSADAIMLAGSVASMVHLGDPDIMTLSLVELSGLAGRIARATNLPLIVDADHGFGNAQNVRRTVRELEREGVAALTIEDTLLPVAFGTPQTAQLISIPEMRGKLGAALEAREDPETVIIGRTGAAGLSDMGDVLDRLKSFEDIGVDMVFVRGVQTDAQVAEISAAVDIPIALSVSNPVLRNLDALSQTNIRIVLPGHRPLMAAYNAVAKAMHADMNGASFDAVLSGDDVNRFTCKDEHNDILHKHMRASEPPAGSE